MAASVTTRLNMQKKVTETMATKIKYNDEDFDQIADDVIEITLDDEVERKYALYTFYTIQDRALPDVCDGLKPVQRRILYAMYKNGLTPEKTHTKSARIVGDTMGKYHPHGDSSIYDALVRLAQPTTFPAPPIDGQGNFGLPGVSAAASRYCLTGDTRVWMADGSLVRIDSLVNCPEDSDTEVDVQVLDWTGDPVHASMGFNSGKHPVYKMVTDNGQSLRGSANHPVLAVVENDEGAPVLQWVTLDSVQTGDIICIPLGDAEDSSNELDSVGVLLGAWVSEGWFTDKRAGFNNTDNDYFQLVLDSFDEVVGSSRYVYSRTLPSGKTIRGMDLQGSQIDKLMSTPLAELRGYKSADKHIPQIVWHSGTTMQRSFLASLFEGDGSIRMTTDARHGGKTGCITYSSKSKQLVTDIQELLLVFGVHSKIAFSAKRGRPEYTLRVAGATNILRYLDRIGFVAGKRTKAQKVEQVLLQTAPRMVKNHVPFISGFVRNLDLSSLPWKDREFLLKNNFDRSDNWNRHRARLESLFRQLGVSESVISLMNSNYYFTPVNSVHLDGTENVYSIKVDSDNHSFIAGGFINHNTEARLSTFGQLMTEELSDKVVKMIPNFDDSTEEPLVLPSQIPALLINGQTGIAVAMATNMAPHNPREAINAVLFQLRNQDQWLAIKDAEDDAAKKKAVKALVKNLMKKMPGPDFPTGGKILGIDGAQEAYETGSGKIIMQSKYKIEQLARGQSKITFYEFPYGTSPTGVIKVLRENEEKFIKSRRIIKENGGKGKEEGFQISGIVSIDDYADVENAAQLVVVVDAKTNPEVVVADLFKRTALEGSFNFNQNCLVNGTPKVVNLPEMIQYFINFRRNIVKVRAENETVKREDRLHIVNGLMKVLLDIDKAIAIIRKSDSQEVAQSALMKAFKIDETQAKYVLDTPLRRLTKFDSIELGNEKTTLEERLAELKRIVEEPERRDEIVDRELTKILDTLKKEDSAANFKGISTVRKSEIVGGTLAEHVESAKEALSMSREVSDDPCVIYVDRNGKLQTTPSKGYVSKVSTTTLGQYIAITNKGRGFRVNTVDIAPGGTLPHLTTGERVVVITSDNNNAVVGTKHGVVFAFQPNFPTRSDEFRIIELAEGDEIIGGAELESESELVFITNDSSLLRFSDEKVAAKQTLNGKGMSGIKLGDGNEVIAFNVVPQSELDKASVVTYTGTSVKSTPLSDYPPKGRATGGVRSHKFLKGEDHLELAIAGVSPMLQVEGSKKLNPARFNAKRDASGAKLSVDVNGAFFAEA